MTDRRNPRRARRRTPADPGAVVLSGAGAVGPAGPGGKGPGVRLTGEPLVIDLDARAIVDFARREILEAASENIAEGRRPDGGPQRPLSNRAKADPRRVSEHRGYRTGHLADNLRASPIKGDSQRASSSVLPPTDRNVFVATEAERGVTYLAISGEISRRVDAAISAGVAAMLEGRAVEAEQGEPTAREERKP